MNLDMIKSMRGIMTGNILIIIVKIADQTITKMMIEMITPITNRKNMVNLKEKGKGRVLGIVKKSKNKIFPQFKIKNMTIGIRKLSVTKEKNSCKS